MQSPLFSVQNTIRSWVIYLLAMGVVAGLCFAPLYHHPLDMDDADYLEDSAAVSAHFPTFFSPDKTFAGRPVTEFLLWLTYAAVGAHAATFHILAIAVHYLACIALVLLCRRLRVDLELSFLTGLLFLLNFAHFHAVYWISAIAYSLSFILSCLAAICCCCALEKEDDRWLIGAYLASLLAVLSHASAIASWLFCLFVLWQRRSRSPRQLLKFLPLGVLLAGTVVAIILRYPAPPQIATTVRFPAMGDVLTDLLWFCSRLLTTAHWLLVPLHTLRTWELFLGGALLAAGAVVFLRADGRSPVRTWLLWTLVAMLPFLTMSTEHIANLPAAGPSRLLYVASAGTAFLLAAAIRYTGSWFARRTRGAGGKGFAAAALVGLSASSLWAFRQAEAAAFYSAGLNYIAHGQVEDGRVWLHRAIAEGNDRTVPLEGAYVRLGLVAFLHADQIQSVLEEGLSLFPHNHTLKLYKQVWDAVEGDPISRQQAVAQLQQRMHPQDSSLVASTYFNLGFGYAKHGKNLGKAVSFLDSAIAFNPAKRHPSSDVLTQLGVDFFNREQWTEAMAAYRQALALDAGNLTARVNLGRTHLALKDYESAIAVFRESLELEQDEAVRFRTCLYLAGTLQLAGLREAAIEVLHTAARLKPEEALVHRNLGDLYYSGGQFALAVQSYREMLRLQPDEEDASSLVGKALLAQGDLSAAEAIFHQAVNLHPRNPNLCRDLGEVQLKQGRVEAGTANLQQAIDLGLDHPETYLLLGQMYREKDQPEKALQVYRRLLEAGWPHISSSSYTQLGLVLFRLGDVENSTRAYRRALEREPENAAVRTNLGWNLYLQERYQEAAEEFRAVLERQPNPTAQFNLGMTYLTMGQVDSAGEAYARGMAQFGPAAAAKSGAFADLEALIEKGIQVSAAREILRTYQGE